ncbi:MAG: hypothetical protein IPN63_07545 [Gammaproteobacteria bacterium]|nr:hypothetical protein [Gammaproteobacteria bacterium]
MRDRIYNAIDAAERLTAAALDVMRNKIQEALDDAATHPPADNAAPTPDVQWPKRAEIVAVLSAHYGAPAEAVEELLTEYFSW